MKKVIVSLFVAVLMLAVAACSGQNSETKADNSAQQSDAAKAEAAKAEGDKAEATTNDKLESKKLLSDKIEILLPKDFEVMSEEMAKVKYPSENRPGLIYTNKDGSINVAFNHTESPIEDSQMATFKDQLKQVFQNMYPNATWYGDEVTKVNGKNVGVFELLTPAADTKIYNMIFFTELDGKVLMTTFNCSEAQMEEWKPIAKEIMQSLKTN